MSFKISDYVEPSRPYSSLECKDIIDRYNYKNGISKIIYCHKRCNHFYNVLKNSKKYNEVLKENELESITEEIVYTSNRNNCSVCWNIRKFENNKEIKKIVRYYDSNLNGDFDGIWTYDLVDLYKNYYNFIYNN